MNLDDMTKLNKVLSQRIEGAGSGAANGTAVDIDPRNIVSVGVPTITTCVITYVHGVTEKTITYTLNGQNAAEKLLNAQKCRDYFIANGHNGLGFGKTVTSPTLIVDAGLLFTSGTLSTVITTIAFA